MESFESNESAAVVLQPATESDIETLLDIERSVVGPVTYSGMLEVADWKEEFENCSVFLIRNGNEVVGSISYEVKSPDHIYISGLVVKPEFQGKGIATTALKQVLAKYANAKRIDLVTHPDNPALKLYESLGFKVESRVENYWGEGEPRLVLALERDSEG